MNITFVDNEDLIKQLREARPSDLIRATPGVSSWVCQLNRIHRGSNAVII